MALVRASPRNARVSRRVTRSRGGGGRPFAAVAASSSASITREELPHSRIRFTVHVPSDEVKDAMAETLKTFETRVTVPGFRPGASIPSNVLMGYVGKDKVAEEAVEGVLIKNMQMALGEEAGWSIKDSEDVETSREELLSQMLGDAGLTFKVSVDVAPTVRWGGSYKGLKVVADDPGGEEEAAKRVEGVIRKRMMDLGTLRVASDEPIEWGDVAVVTTEGYKIEEDGSLGEAIVAAQQKGFKIDTAEPLDSYIPGFVDAIIGLKAGESNAVDLVFPSNWAIDALRGKKGHWKLNVNEHFKREMPEESDELAGKLQPGMKTMAEMRKSLLDVALERMVKEKEDNVDESILMALEELSIIDMPESLIQEQGQQMYLQKLIQMQSAGSIGGDQIAKLATREMVDNFIQGKREDIAKTVKLSVAVEDIFNVEGLNIEKEELDEEMANARAEFEKDKMEYDPQKLEEQAEEILMGRKVLMFLREHADITYKKSGGGEEGEELYSKKP